MQCNHVSRHTGGGNTRFWKKLDGSDVYDDTTGLYSLEKTEKNIKKQQRKQFKENK